MTRAVRKRRDEREVSVDFDFVCLENRKANRCRPALSHHQIDFQPGLSPPATTERPTNRPTDRPTDRPTGSPDRPGNGNWECESRLISRWVRSACGCRTDRYKLWAGHAAGASTLSDAGTERERERKEKLKCNVKLDAEGASPMGFSPPPKPNTGRFPAGHGALLLVLPLLLFCFLFSLWGCFFLLALCFMFIACPVFFSQRNPLPCLPCVRGAGETKGSQRKTSKTCEKENGKKHTASKKMER